MVLILGILACIGPLSIDAYLPAFGAIGDTYGVTPEQVQLTLGLYVFAYALMVLFHGTLSDSFGRRRVILTALGVYAAGSVLVAAAPTFEWMLAGRVLQGLSGGAGMVVGQAVVNECYRGSVAQKTMSYIMMVFSVAPALAPIIGGYTSAYLGWRAIFILLAVFALCAAALCGRFLPETLAVEKRQHFSARNLLANFRYILRDRFFVGLALSFAALFGGFAFLIGGAHDFVTHVLKLPDTAFGYLFVPMVAGMVSGSFTAARLATRWPPAHLIRLAFSVLALSCVTNLAYTSTTASPSLPWAVAPLTLFSFGLSIAIPNMTITMLRRMRDLSGTAASMLGFAQMLFFSVVSGWLVPFVYGSAFRLALALTAGVAISALGWGLMHRLHTGEQQPSL